MYRKNGSPSSHRVTFHGTLALDNVELIICDDNLTVIIITGIFSVNRYAVNLIVKYTKDVNVRINYPIRIIFKNHFGISVCNYKI